MRRFTIAPALFVLTLLLIPAGAIGQVVEIPTSYRAVRLEVARSAHRVTVYRGEKQIKSYPVAVGRRGWETPLGQFQIFQMKRNPSWEHPLTHEVLPAGSPGNELGGYWIGFSSDPTGTIGFHATPHPESVGKSSSHGCVRMYVKDIRELFAEVGPGTLVSVVP